MFDIDDENLRALCIPVMDVKYAISNGAEKVSIERLDQLTAIAKLYDTYKSKTFEDKDGKHPYISICKDDNNVTFVKLEKDRILNAKKMKNLEADEDVDSFEKKNTSGLVEYVADCDIYIDSSSTVDSTIDNMTLHNMLTDYHILTETGNIEFTIPLTNMMQFETKNMQCCDRRTYRALARKSSVDYCLFAKYNTKCDKLSIFYKN
jgi:hypothetical protein